MAQPLVKKDDDRDDEGALPLSDTGEHKGYSFVAFKTKEVAQKAIEEIHSKEFKGCQRHGSSTKKNKDYQEKLPVVVLRVEEIIYSKANSEVCKKPGEEGARDISGIEEPVITKVLIPSLLDDSKACNKAKLLKVKVLIADKEYQSAIAESGFLLKEDENNLEAL
ncbi:hypothetical protein JHK82_042803 [Glycine max]|nr:hypothetical protein JHK86_042825 [Glycine max]KAG5105833.1 hypothetical protein JHK82_042803 [Glycine max]